MAKTIPIVRGNTLTYQQDGQEQVLLVETPAWCAWLETVSSFAFTSQTGTFTARKERAGNQRGGWYWKAYRTQRGKLTSLYLGKSETLTLARLQAVAQALADAPVSTTPGNDTGAAVSQAQAAAPGMRSDSLLPLLSTKLHPPRPRARLVRRPQLAERLTQGVLGQLTLVSAPAGFGKTTLFAQWLSESGTPVAWLSLEPQDNEPVRFLSYLIAALQTLDPHLGTGALTLLQRPQPVALEMVLTLLTNDVENHEHEGGDFALVLDDYHVIEAAPVHHALLYLVEHLPSQMHLILLTRADPPLPLSRLRARGQLCEVRATDLRFAPEESSAFLQGVMELELSPQEIALLQTRTEGWIAGLQLAALSLRGRSDTSSFLTAFTGSHRFVLDYLSEEVLLRQLPLVQSFLLRTSILERLSGPLCDAVTGQEASQKTLEVLEQANLFVISLDDERRWYRYHHLFAEVLLSHLQQRESELVPKLHRRASAWYEQHKMLVEAVRHALAASDTELAARLIEQYGIAIALRGQVHLVLGWLSALPIALVRSRARLCLYYSLTLMFTNQLEAAETYLYEAEQCTRTAGVPGQARIILAWVAGIRANLALFSGDLPRCVTLSHQALELLPELEHLSEAETLLRVAATVGPTHAFLVSGDVTAETERLVLATATPLRATGDLFALLTSITLLARLQVLQGRLREAAATYEQVLSLGSEQEVLQFLVGSAAYYFGLGDQLREWNDMDAAEHLLAQGMKLVKGILTVDAYVVTLGYIALARLQQAQDEHNKALATMDALTRLSHQRHYVSHLEAYQLAVRVQIELAQGNKVAAIRWLEKSGLSIDDELSYSREREYLTLVRVLIAQGRDNPAGSFLQDALGLLARLLSDAEAKARMGSALEILLLRALVFDAQGNRDQALGSLKRAILLAEPEGYIRLFIDEGPAMLALLQRAQAQGIAPIYAATLLSAFGEQTTGISSRPGSLAEPLTGRELDVLRLLAAGLSNSAIAQELIIAVGTVKRHVNSIYGKLGVNSRTQAIACAQTLKLL